jgi:hypothetical protein
MKVFSLIVVPGILALAISAAKADPSPNPATSGAQTMPSGAEPDSPPPATYDPGTPGIAPATVTPTAATPTAATPTVPAAPSATDAPAATPSAGDTATAAPAASGAAATAPAAAPPPTTFDDNNPATPPPGAPAAPMQTPSGATNVTILPPPPNGQTVESVPVQPMPPLQVGPEGTYPGAAVYSHVGVGLLVGGGFQDFTNGRIKDVTGDGGYWTARIVAGTRQYVGMEAAYVGDARSISGLGFSSSSMLISNGLQGNLRLNVPIVRGVSLIEPFGFVGVGWSHYTVTSNNAAVSDVTSRDDVLTLPYGGGLQYSYRGFMADARFTYTQTYYNNLTQTIGGNLNTWGVGGQIGFEY